MTTSERTAGGRQAVEKPREQAGATVPIEAPSAQATEQTLNDSLRRMIDSVRPEAIFGAPVEREGAVIIPCSEVRTGFGLGGGSGFGPANAQSAERGAATEASPSAGSGIGGGGGAQGRPVAVIVVSQGKARVLPIVDVTRFMVAALTTAGFVTLWRSQAPARSRERIRPAPSAARFARALRAARFARALRTARERSR